MAFVQTAVAARLLTQRKSKALARGERLRVCTQRDPRCGPCAAPGDAVVVRLRRPVGGRVPASVAAGTAAGHVAAESGNAEASESGRLHGDGGAIGVGGRVKAVHRVHSSVAIEDRDTEPRRHARWRKPRRHGRLAWWREVTWRVRRRRARWRRQRRWSDGRRTHWG